MSRHSNKLFAPSDFRDEDNYVRSLTATASLAFASVKSDSAISNTEVRSVVESVQEASAGSGRGVDLTYWRNRVLWVDDRHDNNVNERSAFEAMGVTFSLASSTDEALEQISKRRFAAIISDMGRKEGTRVRI